MKSLLTLMVYLLLVALVTPKTSAQSGRVYIDEAGPADVRDDGLRTNTPVTFRISLENNSGRNIIIMANGFRIYSPDNAQWDLIQSTWNFEHDWFEIFAGTPMFAPIFDHPTEDTVGFKVWIEKRGSSFGIPDGFNEIAWLVTIEAVGDQAGKTVCIDSSYFHIGGWYWSLDSPPGMVPDWDGPYCYSFTSMGPLCGDFNGDGGYDITDLTFLVDYFFRGGPPPPSAWAADWNGDCQLDIIDLDNFITFMFRGSLPPVCCENSL